MDGEWNIIERRDGKQEIFLRLARLYIGKERTHMRAAESNIIKLFYHASV